MIKAVIFDMFETLVSHYDVPLYFGQQMAQDCGVELEKFHEIWHGTEELRTLGKITFEEVIRQILEKNGKYDSAIFEKIIQKRKETKRLCFKAIDRDIVPMFETLKGQGLKLGLLSNCFSEEAEVICQQKIAGMFDSLCLSCQRSLKKPDPAFFNLCIEELGVKAEQCVFVGDGGSGELYAARKLGMKVFQACWYINHIPFYQGAINSEFVPLDRPLELVDKVTLLSS